jgi:hypothetical protein
MFYWGILKVLQEKTENGSPGDFLNPFVVCSLCKRKFVVCLFVDEETKGSYPFANGLNGLAFLEIAFYNTHSCK